MSVEPEDQVSAADEARIALLSDAGIERIDQCLLENIGPQWRKLAMVVALAMTDSPCEISGIPDAYYSRRVGHLASLGKVDVRGDLRRMRYCEVRLPESGRHRWQVRVTTCLRIAIPDGFSNNSASGGFREGNQAAAGPTSDIDIPKLTAGKQTEKMR